MAIWTGHYSAPPSGALHDHLSANAAAKFVLELDVTSLTLFCYCGRYVFGSQHRKVQVLSEVLGGSLNEKHQHMLNFFQVAKGIFRTRVKIVYG